MLKKTKVLLINPKFLGKAAPWIPLGLLYLSSYLKKFNIEVKIIDNNIRQFGREELPRLLAGFRPDVVGTGGFTVQCEEALRIGRIVKSINPHIKLVYGGIHFMFMPEDGLKYGDIVIVGEGEKTFLEICENLDNYRNFKGVIRTTEFIKDLDEIGFPDYRAIDLKNYSDSLITGEKAISIMTGRGCPYDCLFCASPQIYKKKVRYNSMDYVMGHIKFLIDNYGLKNLRIMDDTFTINKKRIFEFCDEIEKRRFKLNMTCLTNVKTADFEMFKKMKEVGFSIVAFGIESGNDRILQKINKMQTKDVVREGVALAKKAGLATECLYMIGNIGETEATIRDTINFAMEINPPSSHPNTKGHYNWFQYATPFPGSKFYEIAEGYGKIRTRNFTEYTHSKPIFVPTGLTESLMIEYRSLGNYKCNNQNKLLRKICDMVILLYLRFKNRLVKLQEI